MKKTNTKAAPSSSKLKPTLMVVAALVLIGVATFVGHEVVGKVDDPVARSAPKYTDTLQSYQAKRGNSDLSLPVVGGSTAATSASQIGQETTVTLYEDSGSVPVNVLQADITYPADKLAFVAVGSGSKFTIAAATDTSTTGKIRIARGVTAGETAVSGSQTVLTITFKKLVDVDAATAVSVDQTNSLLVASDTNKNILGDNGTSLEIR